MLHAHVHSYQPICGNMFDNNLSLEYVKINTVENIVPIPIHDPNSGLLAKSLTLCACQVTISYTLLRTLDLMNEQSKPFRRNQFYTC